MAFITIEVNDIRDALEAEQMLKAYIDLQSKVGDSETKNLIAKYRGVELETTPQQTIKQVSQPKVKEVKTVEETPQKVEDTKPTEPKKVKTVEETPQKVEDTKEITFQDLKILCKSKIDGLPVRSPEDTKVRNIIKNIALKYGSIDGNIRKLEGDNIAKAYKEVEALDVNKIIEELKEIPY
jgi:hypothetical protein